MFQECYSGNFMINLENIFESDFHKSSGLYVKSSEGVCDTVCF